MKYKKIMIALTAAAALTAAGMRQVRINRHRGNTDTGSDSSSYCSTGYNKSAADFNTGHRS